MKSIFVFISTISAQTSINGIYFSNDVSGQSNFDYNSIDNSAKIALDSGFNRIYIGNYDFFIDNPMTDILKNWSQLSLKKRRSVKRQNSKICMIVTGFSRGFRSWNVDDFTNKILEHLDSFDFDCVVFDLRAHEATYPTESNNPDFNEYILQTSRKICAGGFAGNLIHRNYPKNLGNFMFYNSQPYFPTVYADIVNQLHSENCLETVNLDYFIEAQPDFQTDEVTLFHNSTGLKYANGDYSETAINEIIKNNNITSDLLVIGKPLGTETKRI